MQRSPVFGFNCTKCEIILTYNYLTFILFGKRVIEPIVNKKANHFAFSTFVDAELLNNITKKSITFVFHINGSSIQ